MKLTAKLVREPFVVAGREVGDALVFAVFDPSGVRIGEVDAAMTAELRQGRVADLDVTTVSFMGNLLGEIR